MQCPKQKEVAYYGNCLLAEEVLAPFVQAQESSFYIREQNRMEPLFKYASAATTHPRIELMQ